MESKVIEYKQDEGSDLQAGWQILQTQLFHFDIDHCLSPTAKVTRAALYFQYQEKLTLSA